MLLFENEEYRIIHTKHYLPSAEIEEYNVIIDGKYFFNQPVKNSIKT